MSRYLYKYLNQKKEFHCLKHHEKDYAFSWMRTITDANNQKVFDLYLESEAAEYIFYSIILTYGENVDEFMGRLYGPLGKLPKEQINKDQTFLIIICKFGNHKLRNIRALTWR